MYLFLIIYLALLIAHVDGFSRFFSSVKTKSVYSSSSNLHNKYLINKSLSLSINKSNRYSNLQMAATDDTEITSFDLAAWFNPNTRGGVIVWSILITIIPVVGYQYLINTGMNPDTAGADVGAGFVALSMIGWASTYIFRVANKDMTYATQLKDYENAVLQKRLEELEDDEINALMEEIEIEDEF